MNRKELTDKVNEMFRSSRGYLTPEELEIIRQYQLSFSKNKNNSNAKIKKQKESQEEGSTKKQED